MVRRMEFKPSKEHRPQLRYLELLFRRLVRRRGFIWRGFLAWAIGCLMLFSDEIGNFDTRFQVRGNQKASENIILINFSRSDVDQAFGLKGLRSRHEVGDVTDSYYWDLELWTDLLKKLKQAKPSKIGVTLFFDESLLERKLNPEEKKIFYDPKIIWAALTAPNERPEFPAFTNSDKTNVGSIEILHDQDGIIRRFSQKNGDIEPLVQKLAGRPPPRSALPYINFRGDNSVFTNYNVSEILSGQVSTEALRGKIILIGGEMSDSSQYLTPMGFNSRQSVLAQMTNHLIEYRSISRLATSWYILSLFLLMLLTVFVMTQYPQTVAFIFVLWIATLWSATSVWVFDSFYFWLPITSSLGTIISCYMIFLGYQANKIERKHFLLQQQQKYLQELEQLKNNFVSLISHDLKTPIAKIQAILDRLAHKEHSQETQTDLKTLRQCNDELNRYIQSVLRMLRVESRDFKLHIEVGDINEVINDAVKQLELLAKEKSIRIQLELEPLFSSEFDLTLIREVMVNLIENAIKYTPKNGLVSVRSFERNQNVQVEVIDTGEGISNEELPQIWGKFVRGKDQDLKTKGTGLGLYLVKFFIELHGGQVWLESNIGVGTKACFTLPVEYERNEGKDNP